MAASTIVAVPSKGWRLTNSRTRSMGKAGIRGAKKGAHYSAPPPLGMATRARVRPGSASRRCGVALAALLLWAQAGPARAAAPAPGHAEVDARKAEEQLESIRSEIERITHEVSVEAVERDRLTRELRSAE